MSSILNFFRRKLLRPVPRKKLVQTPRFVKPCLEILEGRLVLDAMLFVGAGGTLAAPLNWFVAANWADLTNPPNVHVPDASDDVGIPGAAGVVAINGDAEVNSIVTGSGSTLQTTSGSELKIDSNPPATLPPSFPADPLANSNFFGGSVIDAGLINLNTTNPFTGTNAAFAGGTTIGPGDLKGNLEAGPNSSFTFSGGTNTFVAGATLSGMGTGSIIIAAPVTVMGALNGRTETLSVATGGTLGGPGALDEFSTLTWTGGAISVGGGVTVESSGTLTASGAASKTLSTVLTNNSPFANLGGGGMLILSAGGSVVNSAGNLQLSLPSIVAFGGIGVSNGVNGTLEVTAPAATPTTIMVPFTNKGLVKVDSGDALVLSNSGPAVPPDTLDGVFQLMGSLTLLGAFSSVDGFTLDSGPGALLLGDGTTTAALTIPAGVTETVEGNLEVTGTGTLTGAGGLVNSGRLQLDAGATTGFGWYQQTSIGTLALTVVTAMGGAETLPSPLVVTGTAQLSGTLVLLDYTPVVGDSFTVVRAGAIADHFDTIPDGMSETDGAASVTVTQVRPPA